MLAYCGHTEAIARVGEQGILHDDQLDIWIGGLKRWGTETTLCAALAVVDEAFSLLDRAPWVRECASPLLNPARAWAAIPDEENANLALAAARRSEEFADMADNASTLVGDWWSYEAIEMCGLIPAAIALHTGLMTPSREIPGPPEHELVAVCRYFSRLPSHVERSENRIRNIVAAAITSWLLGRRT